MHLVSYSTAAGTACGTLRDGIVRPLRRPSGEPYLAVDELLAAGRFAAELDAALEGDPVPLGDVRLLPPVIAPTKILCAGVNYADHLSETGRRRDPHPTLFTRFADSQIADGAPLTIPDVSSQLDYEGELALVVGRTASRLSEAEALDAVAGYAVYDDGSVRDWQRHSSQWTAGKNFTGTGAFGPALVTADEIDDLDALEITTTVNGETRQHARLSDLIFSIPELLAYITSFTTLRPGDVVVTGTPGGVGLFRDPPVFLRDGDVVEVAIPGVGTLRNPVRSAARAAPHATGNAA